MKRSKKESDLRVRRTHKLLWNALEELLSEPSQAFNSITVNQICERAMVHRTTFYKHFEDKYDLLFFGMSQFKNDYMKLSLEERVKKPFENMSKMPNLGLIEKIVKTQKMDDILNSFIKNQVKETLQNDILEMNKRGESTAVPIEIITEFYSGVIALMSTWWFQNDRKVPAEQMDRYLFELMNKDFFK